MNMTRVGESRAWPPRGSFLAQVSIDDRNALLGLGSPVSYQPGEHVLREGDEPTHVVVLLSGLTKVVYGTEGGHEVLLAIRVGGDLIGELGVLEGARRSANVVAASLVSGQRIGADHFTRYLEKRQPVTVVLASMIGGRLRTANRRRVENLVLEPRVRVCRVLAELVTAHGYPNGAGSGWDLGVPLTQEELASLAGLRLRSVEKQLHDLRNEGIIAVPARRHIEVLNLKVLRQIAD